MTSGDPGECVVVTAAQIHAEDRARKCPDCNGSGQRWHHLTATLEACTRCQSPRFRVGDPCVPCGERWPCEKWRQGDIRHTPVLTR